VPVIFMGYGIKPGTYDGDATPADVAPTLARLAGVRLPKATGRVLTEAMAPEPRGESADSAPRAPGSIPSAASGAEQSR
jgi:arylsulfatase A-like enzyme